MKKIIFLSILILVFNLVLPVFSFANDTANEEAEGGIIWEKIRRNKEVGCQNLSEQNFEALGEYFMGLMIGDSHEAMNNMMIQMMGKEGEEQMHIAMGKRMSNCEPDAPMPQNMMNMMMGGGMTGGDGNSMMGNFGTNPMRWVFGWVFMILFWVLVILAIVALIKWILNQSKTKTPGKSALDILKERYARGEISKQEFDGKRKDLI